MFRSRPLAALFEGGLLAAHVWSIFMSDKDQTLFEAASGGAAEIPLGGDGGMWPDLRVRHKAWLLCGEMNDKGVRAMLSDCCQFLRQLVLITSNVIETIGIGQVRKIVAAEMPIPSAVIREDGTVSEQATPAEPERDDHRKNPRGRKHPVITLVQMALQGIRLILQITVGTNPNAHAKETLEQKQVREQMKEQERTFKDLLNGKI
jgi:hypothetical protein